MKLLLGTFAAAFTTCLLVTPVVRKLALRLNIVDSPDKHRKLHQQATPLGGGVAVLLSFLGVVAAVLIFSDSQRAEAADNAWFLFGIITSAVVLCAVGLLDDRHGLRGRQKLLGQVGAVCILLSSGLVIDSVQIFGSTFELGLLSVPFTMFWLLGAINALNLIDGVDGLATSVGIILSAAASVMAILTGHPTEAFLAMAVSGALCGFLIYNSPPASIFLGDAGSMIIGLILGALAIRSALKGPATVVLSVPTAILAIPIFDVSMAIVRRRLTGRSIYTTDRGSLASQPAAARLQRSQDRDDCRHPLLRHGRRCRNQCLPSQRISGDRFNLGRLRSARCRTTLRSSRMSARGPTYQRVGCLIGANSCAHSIDAAAYAGALPRGPAVA